MSGDTGGGRPSTLGGAEYRVVGVGVWWWIVEAVGENAVNGALVE
jgi:hypothetical protein